MPHDGQRCAVDGTAGADLQRRHLRGRVAGSLLHAIGMPELVTESLGDYEQTALALAGAPQRLAALRHELQTNRDASALFDLPKCALNIEAAYTRMWQNWRSGQKPVAFSIEGG